MLFFRFPLTNLKIQTRLNGNSITSFKNLYFLLKVVVRLSYSTMTMRLRILKQKSQGLCVGRCLERPALDLKRRPHVRQGKVGIVLAADAARTLRMALLFLDC